MRPIFSVGGMILVKAKVFSIYPSIHLIMSGMFANGPAIWGGCVTRRKHPGTDPGTPLRAGPVTYPGARRVWHVFLQSMVQILLHDGAIAVQF